MTKEESIAMWKVEKAHTDKNLLTKKMNKLFDLVEELIMNGDLMYDQFSGDMLDEVTTTIIEMVRMKLIWIELHRLILYVRDYMKNIRSNITTQSLEKEIMEFQQIIQKYQMNPEYVHPKIPLALAQSILQKLSKEYYLGYRID